MLSLAEVVFFLNLYANFRTFTVKLESNMGTLAKVFHCHGK